MAPRRDFENLPNMAHVAHLEGIARRDVEVLREKEATYQGSWKAAGGRSAWFMLRRNMDRLLEMMKKPPDPEVWSLEQARAIVECLRLSGEVPDVAEAEVLIQHLCDCYVAENVFAMIREDPTGRDGTVLAVLRDLRRYCLLVEAEMVSRRVIAPGEAHLGITPQKGAEMTFDALTDRELSNVLHGREPHDNGEFTASSMGTAQEALRAGTPEDGGHHEAQPTWTFAELLVGDTVKVHSIALEDPREPGRQFNIVDRSRVRVLRPETLRVELNDKEHELTPAWFRGLYEWKGDQLKWIMKPEYIKAWARTP